MFVYVMLSRALFEIFGTDQLTVVCSSQYLWYLASLIVNTNIVVNHCPAGMFTVSATCKGRRPTELYLLHHVSALLNWYHVFRFPGKSCGPKIPFIVLFSMKESGEVKFILALVGWNLIVKT